MLSSITLALAFLDSDPMPGRMGAEQTLFELFMPGLDEELLLRGTLLAWIDRVSPPRRRFATIPLGIGFAWNALMFPWLHVFVLDERLHLAMSGGLAEVGTLLLLGASVTAIRRATGSVWPCVLVHNAYNSLSVALAWLRHV